MSKKVKIRKTNILLFLLFVVSGIYFLFFQPIETSRDGRFLGILIAIIAIFTYVFFVVAVGAYKKTGKASAIFTVIKEVVITLLTVPVFTFNKKRKK